MGQTQARAHGSPGFWIFLYSAATLAVFLMILISQTAWGRSFITAIGSGGVPILDTMYAVVRGAWEAFLASIPPEYRPGSAG